MLAPESPATAKLEKPLTVVSCFKSMVLPVPSKSATATILSEPVVSIVVRLPKWVVGILLVVWKDSPERFNVMLSPETVILSIEFRDAALACDRVVFAVRTNSKVVEPLTALRPDRS